MSNNKKELLSSSSNSNDDENKDETDSIQNINFNMHFFGDKNKNEISQNENQSKNNGNSSNEESEHSSNNEEEDDDDFDDDEDEDDSSEEKENQSGNNSLNNQDPDFNAINELFGITFMNTNLLSNSSMGGQYITKSYLFLIFDFFQNKPEWYIKDKNTNNYIAVNLTTLDLFDKLCSLLSNYKFENLIVNLYSHQSNEISELSTFKLFMNLYEYFNYQFYKAIKGNLQQNIQQPNMIYNQNQIQVQNNDSNLINFIFGNGNFDPNNCLSGFGC